MTITTQKCPSTIEKSANKSRRGEIWDSRGVSLGFSYRKVDETTKVENTSSNFN